MSASSHSTKSIENEVKSLKTLLKEVSQAVQMISFRQLENETKINELTRAKEEKSQKIKIKTHTHTHTSHSKSNESLGEGSLRINDYYQPPPRRNRPREQEAPREVRVDLPHFHGKENVEIYLDWEMKVEQLFACHRVSEERKVPLATLSFQGDMSVEKDVFIGNLPLLIGMTFGEP